LLIKMWHYLAISLYRLKRIFSGSYPSYASYHVPGQNISNVPRGDIGTCRCIQAKWTLFW